MRISIAINLSPLSELSYYNMLTAYMMVLHIIGGFPYPAILNADLLEHIQRGLRLEKPDNCSPEV